MTLRLFFIISLIAFSAFSVGKSNAQEESEADVEAPALRIIDIPNEEGIITIENETSYTGQTPTLATNQSSVLTDEGEVQGISLAGMGDGSVVLADSGNHTVQKFASNGYSANKLGFQRHGRWTVSWGYCSFCWTPRHDPCSR